MQPYAILHHSVFLSASMKHLPDVTGTLLIPVLLSSQDPMSALYLPHLVLNFTLINWLLDSAP